MEIERIETTIEGSGPLADAIRSALSDSMAGRGKLTSATLDIQGMSGRKFRYFLNNLVERIPDPRYLEIGSWKGSTFCSAIKGNRVTAVAVDDWSGFGGPVGQFFGHLSEHVSLEARTSVLTSDFRKVDYAALGRFNIYFFDGPHSYQAQYDALELVLSALDEEFVFIVDDWNHRPAREGTEAAIRDHGIQLLHRVEIRTTDDNTHPQNRGERSDWHNGCLIALLRKPTG
jgi:hypothetical protein